MVSSAVPVSPLDSTEPGVTEQGINEAQGSLTLVDIGLDGITTSPVKCRVLDPESVVAVNSKVESCLQVSNGLSSLGFAPTQTANIVFASRHAEHGYVIDNEAERYYSPLGESEVIIGVTLADSFPTRAETNSAKYRTLKSYSGGEPPLIGGTERGRRARNTKEPRRHEVEAAVKAPNSTIGISGPPVRPLFCIFSH